VKNTITANIKVIILGFTRFTSVSYCS